MLSFLRPNVHSHDPLNVTRVVTFIKNWTLPLAILSGIAAYFAYVNIPWLDSTHAFAAEAVAIIQPVLIFSMLFLTFLSVGPHDLKLHPWHWWHVCIQLSLFGLLALMLSVTDGESYRIVMECGMLCLLCPTATAAAVVTRKLGGSAASTTTYTILINMGIAVVAPALLPLAHPHPGLGFLPTFMMIIGKVFPLLICPLITAWVVRRFLPGLAARLRRYPNLAFYLWAVALAIAIAVTVKAIVHSHIQPSYMFVIAVVTLGCCIMQFYVGKLIGRRYGQTIEGGQALGQKNTVFIIWMGYTFLSPVTAVAGGFYSVWHNIFNSYQLYRQRQKSDVKTDIKHTAKQA